MKDGRKIAVIEFGYVGLPVAVSNVPVVCFDIDAARVVLHCGFNLAALSLEIY
jgi:UDP-N-acetyl-D-mannosaminuronate dehydrogenase